ncbi:MAG: SDR family NAD(P)-dependent oxidoreductase [Fidelibacterota bacterium]
MKTALVTRANGGIGLEFVRHSRGKGYDVVVWCRALQKTRRLFSMVPGHRIVEMDVGREDSITGAFDTVEKEIEASDYVVNNAGIPGERRWRPFPACSDGTGMEDFVD